MPWLDFFRSTPPGKRLRREDLLGSAEEYPSGSQDTLAAINELSQAVKNDPDAVEIYLALGNLYRSQGEIERAVHIRNNLIVRPGLDPRFKAKAWYELGRDYKRGGMVDRALTAFEEARKLWGDSQLLDKELARLAADSGEHERAARYYEQLGQSVPQAHHLVRLARQALASGDGSAANKWLTKALKVCPGAVEAWQVRLSHACRRGNWSTFGSLLKEAMTDIEPGLRFLLLENLFEDVRTMAPPSLPEQAGSPSSETNAPPCPGTVHRTGQTRASPLGAAASRTAFGLLCRLAARPLPGAGQGQVRPGKDPGDATGFLARPSGSAGPDHERATAHARL